MAELIIIKPEDPFSGPELFFFAPALALVDVFLWIVPAAIKCMVRD